MSLIENAYRFVRDKIHHSGDVQDGSAAVSASDILREGARTCWAKADLLAALLRANGIPAGFSYQRAILEDAFDAGYCIHALTAVHISSLDAWIRLDARGNREGVHAELSLDEEKPAFAIRSDGKVDYHDNHPAPDHRLMNVLKESTDAIDMYPHHLPDTLTFDISG